jgi:glycosyltransferase involved in cell wall biosynthesis
MKPRVLVFIVAYHAERTIDSVVRRIPSNLAGQYEIDILIIDDASQDKTFERSHYISKSPDLPFAVHALFNPVNQGYGGNQKLGYHYAIEHQYDFVALLHGDGQYAPEFLGELLEPLRTGKASAVFGSRMLDPGAARRGGMPLYKFVGNRILTWIENKLLHAQLSEFHSGYRVYSVEALKTIPFERNSNRFHFDTEIIIQLLIARQPIVELPIPTYYGEEICHVNGLQYAGNVLIAALKARLQELSLFYDRRFDCAPGSAVAHYLPKLTYPSPHSFAFSQVRKNAKVLDLGCAGGYMASVLKREKECVVTGVDTVPEADTDMDAFYVHDLNAGMPKIAAGDYDYILLLDVIEHLSQPESFLEELKASLAGSSSTEVIISTGNVGYVVVRLMLLLGQFNYGKRGILDLTHTRLFTFASLRRAVAQAGFTILETKGVPAPFPLALGEGPAASCLLRINTCLIGVSRGLFSYQMFYRIKPQPSLKSLLDDAHESARLRAESLRERPNAEHA